MTEVTQIKIGKHTVGLVGLKEALGDMAVAYAEQSDDIVAEELLNRLSKKNYIADKVKKDYRRVYNGLEVILGKPSKETSQRISGPLGPTVNKNKMTIWKLPD